MYHPWNISFLKPRNLKSKRMLNLLLTRQICHCRSPSKRMSDFNNLIVDLKLRKIFWKSQHGVIMSHCTHRSHSTRTLSPPPWASPSTPDLVLFLHACTHASQVSFFFFLVFFYSSQNCDKELHSLKDSSGCNRPHSLCSVPSSPLAVHDLSPVDLCRWNLTPKSQTRPKLSSP